MLGCLAVGIFDGGACEKSLPEYYCPIFDADV
jgi:hypothetical protein